MTEAKKTADKSTTFGDEKATEPNEELKAAAAQADKLIEESKAAQAKVATKVEEPKQAEITHVEWEDAEATLREEFRGFLVGRRIEEAIRFAKRGFEAAGGK